MARHTERIAFKTTPGFKGWLSSEASKKGVSVSELIRLRCQDTPKGEEAIFSMITEVKKATKRASTSLEKGMRDAETVLNKLKKRGEKSECYKRGLNGHKGCSVISRQSGTGRQNAVRGL